MVEYVKLLTTVSIMVIAALRPCASLAQSAVCPNAREIMSTVQYPQGALAEGVEGDAVIRFTIGNDGTPRDIVATSAAHPAFSRAAEEATSLLKCDPAYSGRRVELPLTFRLTELERRKAAKLELPSLADRPFREPRVSDELVYGRSVSSATGTLHNSLIRVTVTGIRFSQSDNRIVFASTGAFPEAGKGPPVWELGLRMPREACIPDVLGNLWLRSRQDCEAAIAVGERWAANSTLGTGQCELLSDETINVAAGRHVAVRRIFCQWSQEKDAINHTTEYWYSPAAGYMIRIVRRVLDAKGNLQETTTEELQRLSLK